MKIVKRKDEVKILVMPRPEDIKVTFGDVVLQQTESGFIIIRIGEWGTANSTIICSQEEFARLLRATKEMDFQLLLSESKANDKR